MAELVWAALAMITSRTLTLEEMAPVVPTRQIRRTP